MVAATHIALGVLLLTSAALKTYAIAKGYAVHDGILTDPRLRLLVVEWEYVLGFWLLVGRSTPVRWAAALATFVLFAGASGALGLAGSASCGCLGVIRVSPWWMLAIDVGAIAALLRWHPPLNTLAPPRLGQLVLPVAVVGLLVAAGAWANRDRFGPTPVPTPLEDAVTVDRQPVDCGAGRPGEWISAAVVMHNRTPEEVRVIGGAAGCEARILDDCPALIGPSGTVRLAVRLRLPRQPGPTESEVTFWLADRAGGVTWELPVTLTGVASGVPDEHQRGGS